MPSIPGKGMGHKSISDPVYRAIGYEAIWGVIRAMKTFTRVELIVRVARTSNWKVNDYTVKSFIQRLEKGGFLQVVATSAKGMKTYELIKDCGSNAPRLRRDGTPSRNGRNRENMWRSMRILKTFDYREIALTSTNAEVQVSQSDAYDYIKDLKRAGYLRCVVRGGGKAGLSRYLLVKDTGPKPPIVQRIQQVFDQNLKKVVWPLKEESHAN